MGGGLKNGKIGIIGAGIVGMAAAEFLVRKNFSVTIWDKGEAGAEASGAGAGMLPLFTALEEPEPVIEAVRTAHDFYPGWIHRLEKETGRSCEYETLPAVGPWRDESREKAQDLAKTAERQGITVEIWTREKLYQELPFLVKDFQGALCFPETAVLHPQKTLQAQQVMIDRLGVELREKEPVMDFEIRGRRVAAVRTPAGRWEADAFLLCAGAWCAQLAQKLGEEISVRPIRGQRLEVSAASKALPVLLFARGGYLVPRKDGTLYVGSTLEEGGFEKEIPPQSRAFLENVLEVLGEKFAHLPRRFLSPGLRPASLDGWPLLGKLSLENVWTACGHFTHGHLLGPWSAKEVIEHLTEGKTTKFLETFSLARKPLPARPPWWVRLANDVL